MKHERGCPVEIVYANPVSGAVTPTALARLAPYPHAAALFMDFVLSEEGQKIIVESGRVPTRKGVKAKYEGISNLYEKGVPIVFVTPEDAERWEKVSSRLVNEVLIRKQK